MNVDDVILRSVNTLLNKDISSKIFEQLKWQKSLERFNIDTHICLWDFIFTWAKHSDCWGLKKENFNEISRFIYSVLTNAEIMVSMYHLQQL